MSEVGQAWMDSADRPVDDGPGTPARCVKYAPCPVCKAPAGDLCVFKSGPCIGHHYMRQREYMGLVRAGKAPGPHQNAQTRIKRLEERVAQLEARLKNDGPSAPRGQKET